MNLIRRLKQNEFFRSVFTLISGTSFAQLVALMIYPVLSRIYTTSEHGIFALYLSIIAITGIISTGKYEIAIMLPKEDRKAVNLAALSFSLALTVSLILLIFIIFFGNIFSTWIGDMDLKKWLWFIPLSTILIGIIQILSYMSNRHKRFRDMAVSDVGQSLSSSLVKVSTSKVFPGGGGLITGSIAGHIVGAAFYLNGFIRREVPRLKDVSFTEMKTLAREYSFFPRYNMLHYLTNNFSSNLPIFLISYFYSSAEVGLYSLAFLMVFRPMSLVTVSFTQVFSQQIISDYNKGIQIFPEIKLMANRLFKYGLPVFLIAGFFGPYIFSIIFGEQWRLSGRYMQIMLPWLFVTFIASPLSFLPNVLRQQKKAMWLDLMKFLLRIPAFAIGVYFNNLYLALILFSAVGLFFSGYCLYWYLSISYLSDIQKVKEQVPEEIVKVYPEDMRD